MRVVVPLEPASEPRTPLTPAAAEKLVRLGFELELAPGLGAQIGHADRAYQAAGATVSSDLRAALGRADVVLRLNKPTLGDLEVLKAGAVHVSFLDPFDNPALVRALAEANISAFCMELIPRTSYAQKMDALSSQASLAGYVAVILAARSSGKVLPMMSTPAGTIAPARVFVVGAGVAGLQAIATAKRLGALVEAYDTRPVVEEQVRSLGARFVRLDLGETGQTEQGYAKALTDEQLERQRQQMARYCANADIVITTAQVFGKPAPRLITADMVAGMRPGSVIVDLAASTGGNVEGTRVDEDVDIGGVRILGLSNFAGEIARDASQMYASNVANLLEHLWDKEAQSLTLDVEDPIVEGALLTHQGAIRHPELRELALTG